MAFAESFSNNLDGEGGGYVTISNLSAFIPNRSICQMSVNFSRVKF